jgi:hypothetical protein|tara:strand:+ start:1923 stop:2111 length:189 start_codon:yes stop_codon:yes gene_type:complete
MANINISDFKESIKDSRVTIQPNTELTELTIIFLGNAISIPVNNLEFITEENANLVKNNLGL